jgi:phosphate uptake regulator
MMVLKFLRGQDRERLDRIEAKVQRMIELDRHEFDLAMSALMGEVVAAEVNDELRSTDQKVNQLEREIRRELAVHASVFGEMQTPAVLVYMSIVKDIERIGDYAKNLLDLALDGASFVDVPDTAEWQRLRGEVSEYIADAADAFLTRNPGRARTLLTRGSDLLDIFDDRVTELVSANDPGNQAVARALAHRYLKRVVAHLMNLLSAVVMPLHSIDFFYEDPEDRVDR